MVFNLFGKKEPKASKPVFKDIVWISTTQKFNALKDIFRQDDRVLFVGWFPETVKTLREIIGQSNAEVSNVMEAKYIQSHHASQRRVIFIEHYPLHAKEIGLAEKLNLMEVTVYCALDEAILKLFGSDKIIHMMKSMGMKEDESIEHAMITKSIINAQEKIAAKVSLDQPANSQEDWMKKNC